MNKPFIFKIVGMLILIALMSIAVSYVNDIILERQRNQEQVKQDIARSSARSQTLIGPVLAVPYIEEYIEYIDEYTAKGERVQKAVTQRSSTVAYFLPESLQLSGAFSNEYKQLGLYKALMYQLGGDIKGDFRLPANFNIKPKHKAGVIVFQPAYLGFGISDTRGINGNLQFTFNNKASKLEQGSHILALGQGIHVNLGNIEADKEQVFSFALNLNLRGMENFAFTPIAENNTVSLSSSWQHPHFDGSFLPVTKQISQAGFKGDWAISSLASSNQDTLKNMLAGADNASHLESLAIDFIEPINVYSQADRATKYGLLFIGLTFVGFALFEVLKNLRIHPAQYTLVGLAMTMFYLLLISFAEMIGFTYAYILASAACILLLAYYLSFVLKSKANGFTFASLLTALYGALYGILASEDNALIMGSLLVFGLLAVTMVVTRKVDWYALSTQK
ncbi:MAG: cell envelope integrity protein CreD [Methylophilus sp.]|jgi:inner membrane protein